jgi:hypothetical protein
MPPYSQKNLLTDRPGRGPLTERLKADWGHPILTPGGVEIRLPQYAFPRLRLLGLLLPNRTNGLFQLSTLIYEFMHPDYEGIMGSLRRVLGVNIEGPEWLLCGCKKCKRPHEEADKTPMPRPPDAAPRGRYWLKVIRDPGRN